MEKERYIKLNQIIEIKTEKAPILLSKIGTESLSLSYLESIKLSIGRILCNINKCKSS